jgi:hypothetical protein
MADPEREDGITRGRGGMEDESISSSPSAMDQSKMPMAMQNFLPTTTDFYHCTHFVLSPLIHLQSSSGGWRNNLFWLY